MTVGMLAVQQLHERPIGDGAGHVAQLRQPMEPKLPHAREVGLAQATAAPPCRRAASAPAPAKRLSTVTLSSAASDPMSESSCAPIARQRLVHLDRRAAAAALVQHVHGDRRQPLLAGRIVGRSAPDQQHQRHDRNRRMANGPDAQAARQRRFLDGGKRNGRGRARLGQPRSVDADRLDRLTIRPPASNRECASFGTAPRHDAERDTAPVAEIPPDDRLQRFRSSPPDSGRGRGRRTRGRRRTCCTHSADRISRRNRRPSGGEI